MSSTCKKNAENGGTRLAAMKEVKIMIYPGLRGADGWVAGVTTEAPRWPAGSISFLTFFMPSSFRRQDFGKMPLTLDASRRPPPALSIFRGGKCDGGDWSRSALRAEEKAPNAQE